MANAIASVFLNCGGAVLLLREIIQKTTLDIRSNVDHNILRSNFYDAGNVEVLYEQAGTPAKKENCFAFFQGGVAILCFAVIIKMCDFRYIMRQEAILHGEGNCKAP